MSYQHILYEVKDRILTLTMNRPKQMNASTVAMINEMITAFQQANEDDEVRAIIVTGAGKAFCVGADFNDPESQFDKNGNYDLSDERSRDHAGRFTLEVFNCKKPVIAAY